MTTGATPEPKRVRDGVYRIRWEVSPDPRTGRRRQRSRTVHGDLSDAQRALAEEMLRAGRDDGLDLTGKLLLRDYWEDEYARDVEHRLAPHTVHCYKQTWTKLVEPIFGDVDMRTASRRAIRMMLLDVQPAGRQRNAYKLLRQMFNAAYMDELIAFNPMQGGMRLDKVHSVEKELYTAEDVPAVLEAARDEYVEPFVMLTLLAGLRREEVCALRWEDFTFERSKEKGSWTASVRVERTAQRFAGGVKIGRTKTDKSTRTVVLVGKAAGRLRELARGRKGWLNGGDECGNPDIVGQRWKRLCARKGLKHVTFVGMRASYSTIQAQLGTPDTVVSLMMGHSVLTTRYRHYLGANVQAQIDAAERIEKTMT